VGLNFWVGKTFSTLRDAALVHRAPIVWSRYPRGHVFPLDLARFTARRPLKTIFDIGANQGQTATEFARWFPQASIHSFEPVAANFEVLRNAASKLQRVTAHHAACGSQPGAQFIRYGAHHHLHSLAGSDPSAPNEGVAGETVTVTTVDAVCSLHHVDQIDLLKTDTEGYDLEVLKGAEGMLSRDAVRFIFVEAGLNRQPGQTSFCELSDVLSRRGFVFSGFYDPMRGGEHKEILWFCNALFTHRSAI
jgi:FkbM family methyltransferase